MYIWTVYVCVYCLSDCIDVSHKHKCSKVQVQVKLQPLCFQTGGPGSGKGTQCLKIAERYGFEYVSVGELLRKKMIHNATSNRKWSLIARIITNGELAPQVCRVQCNLKVSFSTCMLSAYIDTLCWIHFIYLKIRYSMKLLQWCWKQI